jgi:hypothetical protein
MYNFKFIYYILYSKYGLYQNVFPSIGVYDFYDLYGGRNQ